MYQQYKDISNGEGNINSKIPKNTLNGERGVNVLRISFSLSMHTDLDGQSNGSPTWRVHFINESDSKLLIEDEARAGDERPKGETFLKWKYKFLVKNDVRCYFLNGPFPASFLYFCTAKNMYNIKFVGDWIRTVDLWCGKRQLYKLSHTRCYFLT